MKKIIVEAEVTLDGIVSSNEMWGEIFKYHSNDLKAWLSELLFAPEALLMGRVTYEFFAQVGRPVMVRMPGELTQCQNSWHQKLSRSSR
jgi:hypothetical protein